MVGEFDGAMLFWVLTGSAAGGAARYAVSEAVAHALKERFPWSTLLVNATGACAIGIWLGMTTNDGALHGLFVLGFLGSYTTVSTFALQSLLLGREGRWCAAAAYVLTSSLICLLAAGLGYAAGAAMHAEGYP